MKKFKLFQQEKGSFLHAIQEEHAAENSYQDQNDTLEENKFVKYITSAFKKLAKVISRLRFGQRVRIPIRSPKNLRESHLLMEGGALGPLLGTYAEKVAAERLVFKLKNAGYDIVKGAELRTKKDSKETKERLSAIFKLGKSGKPMLDPFPKPGKKPKTLNLTKDELAKGESYLTAYRKMGMDIGDRTFEELNLNPDAAYCYFDVVQAGQQGRDDSVDLIVEKYNEKRMTKEFLFSLKAYMSAPNDGKFLEMLKDPMGFLLKVSSEAGLIKTHEHTVSKLVPGINKDGEEFFSKPKQEVMNALIETYGKSVIPEELSQIATSHEKIRQWVKGKQKEYQKTLGLGSNTALDLAKQRVAEAEDLAEVDVEMKRWQLALWIRFFEVALKSKKRGAQEEFKKGVLEILDISKDSPVLIASYLDHKLQKVVTGRRDPSKDLKQLHQIDLKDLDITITASTEKTGPELRKFGINEQMKSGIIIILSHKKTGVELYRVEGKLNSSNSVQWFAKVGEGSLRKGRTFESPEVKAKAEKAAAKAAEKAAKAPNTLPGMSTEDTPPPKKMRKFSTKEPAFVSARQDPRWRKNMKTLTASLSPAEKKALSKELDKLTYDEVVAKYS